MIYGEVINIHRYMHWTLKIHIEEEERDGYYLFTSPDVPGMLVGSRDRQEAWNDIPESVTLLRKLNS